MEEGGVGLGSHILVTKEAEDEPSTSRGSGCEKISVDEPVQTGVVGQLRQASAGNSGSGAGRKLLRPSKKRGQSKDRVPETRTLWQHGQETPVSTPRPTGAAGQVSQEAAALLLHGPFL